jgi:hypothetical protein
MTATALPVQFDRIPLTLRTQLRWGLWRNEPRGDGLATKVPYTRTGAKALPNQPTLWNTFDDVRSIIEAGTSKYDGIGYVFSADTGTVGVDLDGCIDSTGRMALWAQHIVQWLNSYTEVSPSGTGVKIFLRGKLPGKGRKFNLAIPESGKKTPAIEIYDDLRYFTITGHHYRGTPEDLMNRHEEIVELYQDQEALHNLRNSNPDAKTLLAKPGSKGDSEANRSLYNIMLHRGWDVEDVERRIRQTLVYREKHDRPHSGTTFLRWDIERAAASLSMSPRTKTEKATDRFPMTYVSDERLKSTITALAKDFTLINQTEVQDMLRAAGEDVWTRQFIDQVLAHARINTRDMWNALDMVETISKPMSPEDIEAIAIDEDCDRLVDNLLPSRGFSLLAAKPKVGKSTLVRNLIISTLHGGEFLGRKVNRTGPVVYYCLEESLGEVYYHLKQLGLQREDKLIVRRGVMANTTFRRHMKADIETYQPVLIIADPIIRILGLADINDYALTDKGVTPLVELARSYNTHFLAVHHCNKMMNDLSLDSVLGSTAFAGAVDAAILMGRQGDKRYVRTHPRYLRDKALKKTEVIMVESTGEVRIGAEVKSGEKADTPVSLAVRMLNWYVGQDEKLSRSALCATVGVSKEDGLEALNLAEEKGWIVDAKDPSDGRKSYVLAAGYCNRWRM